LVTNAFLPGFLEPTRACRKVCLCSRPSNSTVRRQVEAHKTPSENMSRSQTSHPSSQSSSSMAWASSISGLLLAAWAAACFADFVTVRGFEHPTVSRRMQGTLGMHCAMSSGSLPTLMLLKWYLPPQSETHVGCLG